MVSLYRKEHNVIEAASNGASVAISLIANIIVNLIAFIAILNFINSALTWFGERLDLFEQPVTFEVSAKTITITIISAHVDSRLLGLSRNDFNLNTYI